MKIYKLIVFVAILFSMVGCEDDFLDRPSQMSISPTSYWKTTADLEYYVNQFYSAFPQLNNNSYSGGIYWADDNTDNMVGVTANDRLLGINTINYGGGTWGSSYSNIRTVNVFMENYSKVTDENGVPFDSYKKYVGEAHFFRAYYNFNLLKTYGEYPYIDKVLDPNDIEALSVPRTARNVIADNIIADLEKAIEYMPVGSQKKGNRLSADIAKLFLARVALYEGTWEKYHAGTAFNTTGLDGTAFLQKAATVAEELVNSTTYAITDTDNLEEDYFKLFNQTDYSTSKEVMLWKRYDIDLALAHNAQRYLNASGGARGITKELVDEYLCVDGNPISGNSLYQGDHGLTSVAVNRDYRLRSTIWVPGQIWTLEGGAIRMIEVVKLDEFNDPVVPEEKIEIEDRFRTSWLNANGESICPTGYQIRKGSNPDWAQRYTSAVGTTSAPIFRVSEAYVIFAEAKAELGTITQADVDKSINKLRDRAGVADLNISSITTDVNWIYTGISPLIQEIRRERRVEFAAEGYRYDDVNRWAAHNDVTVGKKYRGVKFNLTAAEQVLFPDFNKELTTNQYKYKDLLSEGKVIVNAEGYVENISLPYGFDVNRDYLNPVPLNQTLLYDLTQNPGWE